MHIIALAAELTNDPLGRGYAGMTPALAAASLNARNRPGPDRDTVPAYEILEAIVPAEWTSLSAAEKQRVQTIISAGTVNLKGANTRAMLGAAFGAGTTTRANLLALQAGPPISRAEELNLGAAVGDGHVVSARGI